MKSLKLNCRFAPTTSGRAHPGTLLAALLSWLDAHSQNASYILRMEDIAGEDLCSAYRDRLLEDLLWFGLNWDSLTWQSQLTSNHENFMDFLAETGLLYACDCSRTIIKSSARISASGGLIYPGTCRKNHIKDWRNCHKNIRINLGDLFIQVMDESGVDLSQSINESMGDPLLRHKDGSFTYQFAVVADDAMQGVNRIIRGQDIATSTATQAALWDLTGYSRPVWRHHLLLLEPQGSKLAKFHQSVSVEILKKYYSPNQMIYILARISGLLTGETPTKDLAIVFTPGATPEITLDKLLSTFSWKKVNSQNQSLEWKNNSLIWF